MAATVSTYPRVRIVSDGTGKGTHVYDGEGNEILKGDIAGIVWTMDRAGGFLGRVKLELIGAKLEATGDLAEVGAPVMESNAKARAGCDHDFQLLDSEYSLFACVRPGCNATELREGR